MSKGGSVRPGVLDLATGWSLGGPDLGRGPDHCADAFGLLSKPSSPGLLVIL